MESQESLNPKGGFILPTTKCPNCRMIWIAPGLMNGDTYECRGCGTSFVVSTSEDQTEKRPLREIQKEPESVISDN